MAYSIFTYICLYASYCLILCISLSPVSYASHENVQQKWFNKLSNNSSSNLTGYRIGVWFDSMVLQFPWVVAVVVAVVAAVATFARCVWHDATKRSRPARPINAPNSPQCNVQHATRNLATLLAKSINQKLETFWRLSNILTPDDAADDDPISATWLRREGGRVGGEVRCSPAPCWQSSQTNRLIYVFRSQSLTLGSRVRSDRFVCLFYCIRAIHSFVHSFIRVFIRRDAAERAEHLDSSCHSNCFCFLLFYD